MTEDKIFQKVKEDYPKLNTTKQSYIFWIKTHSPPIDSIGSLAVAFTLKQAIGGEIVLGNTKEPQACLINGITTINFSNENFVVSENPSTHPLFKDLNNPSKFFTKNPIWKKFKSDFLEVINIQKECAQCEKTKPKTFFSEKCKAVCLSCPKEIPRKFKEETIRKWAGNLQNRLAHIEKLRKTGAPVGTITEEVSKLITEIKDRAEQLKQLGMNNIEELISKVQREYGINTIGDGINRLMESVPSNMLENVGETLQGIFGGAPSAGVEGQVYEE
jgi:hypothetical protein